ncbi:flavin reductase family protein [Methanobacterium ferruginis]|jgi:flavin reductase (DIM6/NTAB) family NADH-FMN oxidoreductase RutF|uniref:flavin reductase family protein n=1 Tax=Methanobacterium ferruginis TaxID=710191 RepID=UPI002574270E|nr:flavin reductase family protein [Methanobacterium ferruginis]MCC7550966.1 flavin reductase family protein [Methanobacterium sp.]BDZ66906.1 flavodoxin [Methanobacterium ferruginis]
MEKTNLGNNSFIYPMPVTILGTKNGETANFMALGWLSRANGNPPLLVAGVNKVHFTTQLIRENKAFSINYPSADMIKEVDYCGLVSGRKEDKSQLFSVEYGELEGAPLIKECSLSLECKLVDIYEMPTHDLFIGEIIASYADEKILTDGKPDMGKLNPLLLTMPDNHYWTVKEKAGKAWNVGRDLKKD